MEQLSIAVKNFNEKVKVMNQTNAKQLVLSADDARNLHSDIYALLANIAEMRSAGGGDIVQIAMDGGRFK
jgi:hypothetical protein